MRPRLLVFALLLTAAVVIVLVTQNDAFSTDAADTEVTVTVDADGAGPRPGREAELTCLPADPRAACERLRALPASVFEPIPPDRACTALYGGPARARIEGTVEGRRVRMSYSLRNGCEIARFERLEPVLDVARAGDRAVDAGA